MRYSFWIFPLCCLAALGCTSESRETPVPVYPVTGVVTLNGEPVVGADVTFYNADAARSAFGRTDDEGRYQLSTFSSNDGAVDGRHIVTIVKVDAPAADAAPVASIESEAYVPPGAGASTTPAKPKSTLPEKFSSQQTSGLTAIVNAEGDNEIDFELTN
ncbi:carboxypeptidase-like regulatory domain-containing protein [Maioricimonas rarisocia]|nr:carboxypeptidase-like regulatory domain-containing protein [Maioricimonas rarisocia]